MINFPNSPAIGQTYTFGGRSWQWTGVAWRAVINNLQLALDAKAPQDISAVSETSINGSEQIAVWKGGFVKTTAAKLWAGFAGNAWAWLAPQRFQRGINVSDGTQGGVGAPSFETYGHTLHLSTNQKIGSGYPDHPGVFLSSVMNGGWGSAEFRMHGAAGWDSFNSVPMLSVQQGAASIPGVLSAKGGVQLGELSPVLKVRVVSGTLSATAGDSTNAAHGLASGATILAVLTAVNLSNGKWWMPNTVTGPYFHVLWDDTYVTVYTTSSSSTSVGRPFKTTILYTA